MIMTYIRAALTAGAGASLLMKVIMALGLAASLLAAYGVWHHKVYQSGVNDTVAKFAAADQRLVQRALRLRGELQLCHAAGKHWDQSTGRCQ